MSSSFIFLWLSDTQSNLSLTKPWLSWEYITKKFHHSFCFQVSHDLDVQSILSCFKQQAGCQYSVFLTYLIICSFLISFLGCFHKRIIEDAKQRFLLLIGGTYSGILQISKMESFTTIISSFKLATTVGRSPS